MSLVDSIIDDNNIASWEIDKWFLPLLTFFERNVNAKHRSEYIRIARKIYSKIHYRDESLSNLPCLKNVFDEKCDPTIEEIDEEYIQFI